MTDAVTTGSDPAPVIGAAPPAAAAEKPSGADPAAASPDPATNGGEPPAASAEPPVEPTWRDDWREQLAGKDEKLLARLKRFASVDNLFKSYTELERKLSSGAIKPTLKADAGEEEVAAYRKAWNIPDKAEEYEIQFPEGYQPSDVDKADLGDFLKEMHAQHATKELVSKAANWYFGLQTKIISQMGEAARNQQISNLATMKAEFGRDYEHNIKISDGHLEAALGQEEAKSLLDTSLWDGTKLRDLPSFRRYSVKNGLDMATDGVLALSDFQGSGKSLDDQYSEALDLKFKSPEKYHSQEHQNHLARLSSALVTRRQNKAA